MLVFGIHHVVVETLQAFSDWHSGECALHNPGSFRIVDRNFTPSGGVWSEIAFQLGWSVKLALHFCPVAANQALENEV